VIVFGGVTPAAIITSRSAASVSGDGLKFPNLYPTAMAYGVHPNLSSRFQMSILAPLAASNFTTFGRFL
jgi:hypothetical protein